MHTGVTQNKFTTNILFIVVNILTEDTDLEEGDILDFLEPTDINSNDITTKTVYETFC